MSSPGFTGGGASDFFTGAARSSTMNTNPSASAVAANNHRHLHPSHPLYRTQQQLPALFLDPSSQITPRHQTPTTQQPPTTLIGKRTLAEFQTQQQHNHLLNNHNHNSNNNHVLSNLLLRSVKPRTASFHTGSPLSPLSPIDFSIPELQIPSSTHAFQTQRFGMPLFNQLRPNPIHSNSLPLPPPNSNNHFPYRCSNLSGSVSNRVQLPLPAEPENKINTMDHRLLELEKQLLEDEEEEAEADAASVITTSAWSETIQNLMGNGSTPKPASSSPTSSTTSSTSSSSSVASPAIGCWKQTLMEAASAIAEGKQDSATEILARLSQVSNPNGNSDQRLMDCMVSALKSRVNPLENPPPVTELFSNEHTESTQLMFENSLCFMVGFMAANFAILEAAFENKTELKRFCVVDFDIGHGKQYVSLLLALSARGRTPPAMVRIVAVADTGGQEERLKSVGEMLARQAERFRIGFEFKIVQVTQRFSELTRESLGCDADEFLAVNFAFKLNRIPDESVSTENPRDELLRRVKSLSPRVVTIIEQEINANTAPFLARVADSCSYYGALFDSVESSLGKDNNSNSERVKVEEGLSRRVCNSLACEGRDRVERYEVFGKWRARMGMAGFKSKPLSQNVAESIKSRLAQSNNCNSRVNSGLTVKEENGGICFGWMGKTLTVASAWL
ncbi:scarecrow-like protein 8 [Arachis stenosperma]|uniref:scarecrow-like protein 8 n=1 Tax=Arachis stenosperma TaxID=217475 RepID=UPI0025AC8B1F|nr:scarecrow-like protein 8 [Arachis stenosperma]